ncbi:peptidase inhibitor family I36 protein [Streptomyces sp. NPDC096032]|uniref:peptidase inhibitor family I36 protein n=1 Tax=Streptomyces sp. NPDC096032 TaxID=3366070 RepID=UPI00381F2A83
MRLPAWSAAAALALAATVVPGTNAAAAQPGGLVPACPGGSICFYTGSNFGGSSWEWTANSGYHDLPEALHDHVGSFVANTDGCLINWQPKETRLVHNGDYRINYTTDFGGRVDGVGTTC